MDTSNNPFTTDSVPYQKAGLLLDLGGAGDVYKQNGTSPSANDLYFLDRPANGKGNFDDDDFGPETDVDAVDDVLLSPAKIVSSPRNNNMFEVGENEKETLEEDLELQRQQMSDFDPVREPREETPTPPADEVPGVTNLVPESDNVAESGEDSEDEWNYYRVEPTAAAAETNQQSTQEVCQKPAQPQLEDDEENMESQLNPDAAEFVPSPTQLMPTMEDILLAESPKKGIPMENIAVPTHTEFQNEVSQRPSELDVSDELEMVPQPKMAPQLKMAPKLPDLISAEGGDNLNPFLPPGAICGKSVNHLENGGAFKDFLDQGDRNFQELQNNLHATDGLMLDESEVSSTKAEFGDDSTVSFMTSELQKTVTESASFSAMEKSFVEQDVLGTDFTSEMTSSDINELSEFNENEQFFKETVTEESLQEDIIKNIDGAVPMSFELQKDLVPEMESKPERVQLESEGTSSFEQDESSSPIHTEDLKVLDLNDQIIPESSAPDSQAPVAEPTMSDLQKPVAEPTISDLQKPVADPKLAEVEAPIMELIPDFLEPIVESAVSDLQVPVTDNNFSDLQESLKEVSDLELLETEERPVTPKAGDELFATGGISPVLQNEPSSPKLEVGGLSPVSSKSLQSPPQSPVLSSKSLQSPPQSPLASKPDLSLELSKELESLPKSPLSELQSPPKSPFSPKPLEPTSPVLSKSLQSPPKSPLWEGSSPVAGTAESTLSTPETVPVGKDTQSPSPIFEAKSPIDFAGLSEVVAEDKLQLDNLVPETDLLSQNSGFDISDLRHPLDRLPDDKLEIPAELVKPLAEISITQPSPPTTQTPPPTPAHVLEDVLASQLKETDLLAEKQDVTMEKDIPVTEKADLETEKEDVKKDEISKGTATVAAAAVAATVATAVAAGVAVTSEEKPEGKKPAVTEVKKSVATSKDKKGQITDKAKTKSPSTMKTTTTAAKPKAPLTSPTKPTTTAARTSTPKKPMTVTSTSAANKVTKTPSTPAAKPKATPPATRAPSTPTTRTPTTTTTKPAAPSPRTRPVNTTTTSKSAVLTNGDVSKAGITKKPASTTSMAKPPSRPATAPATTKTTTTKQLTSVTSRTNAVSAAPRPKPGALNGTANKPRTTGTVATATARSKVATTRDAKLVTDKQVKETANKQISSTRTMTATKSASTTTMKRVTGVTKTSMSTTSTLKSVPAKTATKKATSTASSKTTTKTAVSVTATENNELVKVQEVTASVD